MKTLHITKKGTPQGDIDFKMQIKGRLIAIGGNPNNQYAQQFISQYKSKGAKVIQSRKAVIVDFLSTAGAETVKLADQVIDLEEDSNETIENKLCQFYISTYSKAGFEVN